MHDHPLQKSHATLLRQFGTNFIVHRGDATHEVRGLVNRDPKDPRAFINFLGDVDVLAGDDLEAKKSGQRFYIVHVDSPETDAGVLFRIAFYETDYDRDQKAKARATSVSIGDGNTFHNSDVVADGTLIKE